MSSVSLEPFLEEISKKQVSLRAVLVFQEGREETAFYDDRYASARWRGNIYSASKTVAALGVGCAVSEGLLRLDDRPADFFPEELESPAGEFLARQTLRDLLTMTAGYARTSPSLGWASYERDAIPNWLHAAMNIPVTTEPGKQFHYNNVAPFLVSAMLHKRAGKRLVRYLQERVFDELGIPNAQWLTSPEGIDAGAGSLILSAEELMKIGKLFLYEGSWNGKQLVDRQWIRESASIHSVPGKPAMPAGYPALPDTRGTRDFFTGYGYFVWVNHDGKSFRAIGNGGQLMLVLPGRRAVIVTTADDPKSQMAFMDAVWDTLVPELY